MVLALTIMNTYLRNLSCHIAFQLIEASDLYPSRSSNSNFVLVDVKPFIFVLVDTKALTAFLVDVKDFLTRMRTQFLIQKILWFLLTAFNFRLPL